MEGKWGACGSVLLRGWTWRLEKGWRDVLGVSRKDAGDIRFRETCSVRRRSGWRSIRSCFRSDLGRRRENDTQGARTMGRRQWSDRGRFSMRLWLNTLAAILRTGIVASTHR